VSPPPRLLQITNIVFAMSALNSESGAKADIVKGRICADFVAKVIDGFRER